MTIGSLDIALSGLRAAQRALDVTSNNIANASTPGYSRKILPQSSVVSSTGSFGVDVGEIMRNVDLTLLRDLMTQTSVSASFDTREKFLAQIQAFHGPSEAGLSISAQLSDLKESFIALSDSPENPILLNEALAEATTTARKFNDFASLITTLRNDAQNETSLIVAEVNSLLESFTAINKQITTQTAVGRGAAELEDQRDSLVQRISEHIDVTFYTTSENTMVLQTRQGEILADEQARTLVFNAQTLGAETYYPDSAAGLFIDSTSGVDLTTQPIGGRLGALLELRDETLPQYMAQLDELAQKMASRFESQGLRLFTDADGTVPADTVAPATPTYVGFASRMQVNANILGDASLLRTGTNGNIVSDGSNEVIRKIVDFAFGAFEYQQATGNVDISAGTIFAATGMTATNNVIGNINLSALATLDTDPDITAGAQFSIDIGAGAQIITIGAGETANDLVNNINAALGAGTASLNGNGFLVINATDDVTIADVSLGAAGIAALGHGFGVTAAQDPSFSVQLGNGNPVTITINDTDTQTELLAAINAISGVTATLTVDGYLQITPDEGGDLSLVDLNGSAAFGFLGVSVENIEHSAFRQNNVGASGGLSTGLVALQGLEQFSHAMVALQAENHGSAQVRAENETTFKNTLERRFLDSTGVDIDQEVAKLIELQTAYTAAARMITASEELFDKLLSAFR